MKAPNRCINKNRILKRHDYPPLKPITIKYELSFKNFHFEDEFIFDENQLLSVEKLILLDKVIDCIKDETASLEMYNKFFIAVDKEKERVKKVVEEDCKRYREEDKKQEEEERKESERKPIYDISSSSSLTSSDEEEEEK